MKGKTVVITGANSGIGRATAEALAERGARVVMVCRSRERGETALEEIRKITGSKRVDLELADLSAQSEIRGLADRLKQKYSRVDVLVNNAGVSMGKRVVTADGVEYTLAVNHLGHFLLTNLLLGTLKASKPARVVNVTSASHWEGRIDWDDLRGEKAYGRLKAYSSTKLANVLFTYELARRLEGRGVTVNCVHPGMVATSIWDNVGLPLRLFMAGAKRMMLSPKQGAETVVYLAVAREVEGVTGKYFVDRKAVESSPESYDEDLARKLWLVSERLVGLR